MTDLPAHETREVWLMPEFTPAPGREAELRRALTVLQAASREDEGCIEYTVFDGGRRFILIEGWDDQEHLDAHNERAHTRSFITLSPNLLAGQFTVTPIIPLR